MADIDTYLTSIQEDSAGEDVRGSIVAASRAICDEAIAKGLSFKEALAALLPDIETNLDKFFVPDGVFRITSPGTYDVRNAEIAIIDIQGNQSALQAIEEGYDE